MGKKRRQHDRNVDESEESMGSGEGYNKGSDCPHFLNSINLNRLRKVIIKDKKGGDTCSDCLKNGDAPKSDESELSDEPDPFWICLQCGHVGCGRGSNQHAVKHYETPLTGIHYVVIDTCQWSVWCYKCDKSVTTSNPGYKKKIHEITDLLKTWRKSNKPIQQKPIPIPLCQNEILSTENKKNNISKDFPKICGLMNLGNTCFFNAVLQCLAQTPYLTKVLDDLQVPGQKIIIPGGKFKDNKNVEIELPPIEGILEKTGNFTPVLCKTLTEMQNSDGQVYRPSELLNSLRKKTMQCTDGGQHDSHELLRHLLEQVRSEDLRRYQTIIFDEHGLTEKSKRQCVEDNLKSRLKFYGNKASAKLLGSDRVFRGELFSILQCLECKHSSNRTETFLDLSLPVLVENSLPPILKRKNSGFENSLDSIGINTSINSKHELKKICKANNKKNRTNKTKNHENINSPISNSNHICEGKKGSLIESEESDADVEDNIENEDISIPEIGESGYSSEKPSTVTSPISLSEFRANDQNIHSTSILPLVSCTLSNDFGLTHQICKQSPSSSPTNMQILNLSENKKRKTPELPYLPGPDWRTISPQSSPHTSKNTSTTSLSSDEDMFEKGNKQYSKFETTNKLDLSHKEYSVNTTLNHLTDENSSNDVNGTKKKLSNGISDIMSSITELDLSSSSESFGPFYSQYPVKEGECSIQLCLNQFTEIELMNDNNKVGCTACTERENKGKKEEVKMVCTDSTKKYLISRVPPILILHLKRFQVQKFNFRKVGKHVSFPMLLNLAPVCKDYTKRRIYALYGIVEHSGNLYGGHYVAYVKSRAPLKPNDPRWSFLPKNDNFVSKDSSSESNSELESDEASIAGNNEEIQPPPGQWYYVSDSRVHEVDEKTVLNTEAYLLFYERIL